jgi:excisionase family DNA binding protein
MIEPLHPVPEVATILHCSDSQVLALIRQGRLRALKHCRPFVIPESEINRFISEELDRCNGGPLAPPQRPILRLSPRSATSTGQTQRTRH